MAKDSSVTGIKEIDMALSKLEKKINKRVMKKAMRKSVAEYRKAVRKRVPKRTGNLRKSLTTDVKIMGKSPPILRGRMFFSRTKGKKGYHAHLVEYGTGERVVKDMWGLKKRGYRTQATKMNVGRMKAKHMTKEGFDIKTPEVKQVFIKALARELLKIRSVN